MKRQIELTCASCGAKFHVEADYIIPGISGHYANANGEDISFVDPTGEHHCRLCIYEAIGVILRKEADLPCIES